MTPHLALFDLDGMLKRGVVLAFISTSSGDVGGVAALLPTRARRPHPFQIEEDCIGIIAIQQSMSSDLNAIIAAMHSAMELAHMAGPAVGIEKLMIRISGRATPWSVSGAGPRISVHA